MGHFEKIIEEAAEKIGMKIVAYTIMPNHWHFLLCPGEDGDLDSTLRNPGRPRGDNVQ